MASNTLEASAPSCPRLLEVWAGICERLKFTAHREGELLPNGDLLIRFQGSQTYGIPGISVCYGVLGDAVTIRKILIRL